MSLRIISYNIRYNNPSDGTNAWPYRQERVSGLLTLYRPDLIGLQEVLHDQLHDLIERLSDFGWLGVGRDDGQTMGEYAPIFYRYTRLDLMESGTFWLSETPHVAGSFGWDADCVRIVTWAQFSDKTTSSKLLHLNTHFDHRGEQARIESAYLLRRFLAERDHDGAIIVTGDFNCTVESLPYRALTAADEVESPLLLDAMQHSQTPHHGPTGTTNHRFAEPLGNKIDYIFYYPVTAVTVLRHAILTDHWDGVYSSDHLPVLADLSL